MSQKILQIQKTDQKRRNAEYRKRRARDKSKTEEIMKKPGPLAHEDVSNFYRGLSPKERSLAGVMYIYKCADADMTAKELYDFLKED